MWKCLNNIKSTSAAADKHRHVYMLSTPHWVRTSVAYDPLVFNLGRRYANLNHRCIMTLSVTPFILYSLFTYNIVGTGTRGPITVLSNIMSCSDEGTWISLCLNIFTLIFGVVFNPALKWVDDFGFHWPLLCHDVTSKCIVKRECM